ncbi:hypothetical protein D9M72_513490 [compost metagenome]
MHFVKGMMGGKTHLNIDAALAMPSWGACIIGRERPFEPTFASIFPASHTSLNAYTVEGQQP